jgi:hypothetical protein
VGFGCRNGPTGANLGGRLVFDSTMAASTNQFPRDIDFLPVAYREVGIQRKNFTLRAVVIVAFVGLVGFGVTYQQHLRIVAQDQLAALLPAYEQSQAEAKRLTEFSRCRNRSNGKLSWKHISNIRGPEHKSSPR